jgi:hypothetical protein
MTTVPGGASVLATLVASAAVVVMTVMISGQASAPQTPVTFTKDVAPILQRSCQSCHRPGQMAPMSFLSYEDVRPWARAIKAKTANHEMPPWFIDQNVGIQKFKNDPSLSAKEIATLAKWADSGAPMGDTADLPKPKQFDDTSTWQIGTPDLIVTALSHKVPAKSPDWWGRYYMPSGLTEDRYIQAIETRAGNPKVTHHLQTYAVDRADLDQHTAHDGSPLVAGEFLNAYEVDHNGELFPEGWGRLLKAGSVIKFDLHYHSVGEEQVDQSQVAFKFYPKGYTPTHIIYSRQLGNLQGPPDIPANGTMVRSDGYTQMTLPGVLTALQVHMHTRDLRQCLELIYPNNKTEKINCSNFDFGWHLVQVYTDDVRPIYPAGTIFHVISWHDNSPANNPRNWAGSDDRTMDEMGFALISAFNVSPEEYQTMLNARKKAQARSATRQRQDQ